MKKDVTVLFVELIQVALGKRTSLSVVPMPDDWEQLFDLAQKQTLVGVCFSGIEQLPATQRPQREIIMQWYGLTRQIEERNKVMNERTEEATRFFRSHGFWTWVLKGQGMAQLYPWPERRQSGDIDIWLVPRSSGNGRCDICRHTIYQFVLEHCGKLEGVNYHHIHYPLFEDAEVEVHIYPAFLCNPLMNHRLHIFFQTFPPTDDVTPSMAFNMIFIMLHTYNHLIGHGVGLRQVMDYYFVLRTQHGSQQKDNGKSDTVDWLRKLGMMRFAGAMMWVMHEVFGLEREYMLVEPDETEGRFLLEEIFQTGNMGHYERRNWGSLETPVSRFFYNLRRDWHLLSHYPQEVCWQPLFSVWLNIKRAFWMCPRGHKLTVIDELHSLNTEL